MRRAPVVRAQVCGSWKVWPVAHTINFSLIPTAQRILYINSIQIGYNMFLSVIGNRGA
jgi:protein Mpv17